MLYLEGLRKTFNRGSVNEKLALDGVTFELNAGDFVTIIGSNGAGKSTLLNAVAGVFPLDAGRIYLNSSDFTDVPEYERAKVISRVFQDPLLGTAASMTVEENLVLALRRGERKGLKRAITKKERELFCAKLSILGLGLEDRLQEKVGLLSGGQRQALTLLIATLKRPQLLLLDEHTAALDPKTGQVVLELTRQIVAENKLTTLMVTHALDQALAVGNRTVMMHEGKIILDLNGQQRSRTTVADLLYLFEVTSGKGFYEDRLLFTTS